MIVLYHYSNVDDELFAHYFSWNGDSFDLARVDHDLMERAIGNEKKAFILEQFEQMKK